MKTLFGTPVNPLVLEVSKDHPLHVSNLKEWYDHAKEQARQCRSMIRLAKKQGDKRATDKHITNLYSHKGYMKSIRQYVKYGTWVDNFWGKDQEFRVTWRTL
jgi:hypothetical protein